MSGNRPSKSFRQTSIIAWLGSRLNGWIVTKASQLGREELSCRMSDGTRLPAAMMHINHELDLALLKVGKNNLAPVTWSEVASLPVGAWLATTSCASRQPTGIGVVSVGPRKIPHKKPMLGVALEENQNGEGAVVSSVVEGGGAYAAGIEEGDVIVTIDGIAMADKRAVLNKIALSRGGQRLSIGITRNRSSISVDAQLMDTSATLLDPTEMEVNGSISARASGFSKSFPTRYDSLSASVWRSSGRYSRSRGRAEHSEGRTSQFLRPSHRCRCPAIREMLLVAASRPSPKK